MGVAPDGIAALTSWAGNYFTQEFPDLADVSGGLGSIATGAADPRREPLPLRGDEAGRVDLDDDVGDSLLYRTDGLASVGLRISADPDLGGLA